MKLPVGRTGLAACALVVIFVVAVVALLNSRDDSDASTSSNDQSTTQPDATVTDPGAGDIDSGDDTIVALVGMTLEDAEVWAGARGMTIRPVRIDGEDLAVTMDYREDRINVEIKNGVVSVVQGLG